MTDQSVRITNLDNSDFRVAFDLYKEIRHALSEKSGAEFIQQQLSLYVACRAAVRQAQVDVSALS